MKIIRYQRHGHEAYGVLEGDSVRAVHGSICGDFEVGDEVCRLDQVRLLAPVQPGIVVCNAEGFPKPGRDNPKEPPIFFKASSSVIGNLEDIVFPAASQDLHLGAELAVVMKREARNVPEDEALEYVLGYTCALDVVAMDLIDGFFIARAKSYYSFCPLGPLIATDLDSSALTLKYRHNGVLQVNACTGDMLFSVGKVISYVSEFMALRPLDVVLMGQAAHRSQPADGDVVEVEISGIGTLRNGVVKRQVE